MKTLMIAVSLAGFMAGCTLSNGVVKDVHADSAGNLVMTKCDITYVSIYTTWIDEKNCREEHVKSTSIVKAH